MREALQAVIDWSTRRLAPQLLLADIDAPNERSRRLFASLGFLPAGGTLHRLDLRITDIAALPHLGPASRAMLAGAGIVDVPQLRRLGAVAAFARVRARSPRASLNLLWALHGALTGVDWRQVAREDRTTLLLALEDHEGHVRDR
jgi:DNA transformation protein